MVERSKLRLRLERVQLLSWEKRARARMQASILIVLGCLAVGCALAVYAWLLDVLT